MAPIARAGRRCRWPVGPVGPVGVPPSVPVVARWSGGRARRSCVAVVRRRAGRAWSSSCSRCSSCSCCRRAGGAGGPLEPVGAGRRSARAGWCCSAACTPARVGGQRAQAGAQLLRELASTLAGSVPKSVSALSRSPSRSAQSWLLSAIEMFVRSPCAASPRSSAGSGRLLSRRTRRAATVAAQRR